MAEKNEYKTVLKVSTEGDASGIDAVSESLKKLKEEAGESGSNLGKVATQARDAKSELSGIASAAKNAEDAQKNAAENTVGTIGRVRAGLASISSGVKVLSKLVAGFGLINLIGTLIGYLKDIKEWLDSIKEAADKAKTSMDNMSRSEIAKQIGALADAQERAARAAASQEASIRRMATARAAESDAGYAAQLAQLDAEEQQALYDSQKNDKLNEAGRAWISANFSRRRLNLQRTREESKAEGSYNQALDDQKSAESEAKRKTSDISDTEQKLTEIEKRITAALEEGKAALNPDTAPKKMYYPPGSMDMSWDAGMPDGPKPYEVVDEDAQKRITKRVENELRGENGLIPQRDALQKRLYGQREDEKDAKKKADDMAALARAEKTNLDSVRTSRKQEDDARSSMDALRVEEARRAQSEQFSKDQAKEYWKIFYEQDRRLADSQLPGLYKKSGDIDAQKIALESKEREQREALARLQADEKTYRFQAGMARDDKSLTPGERKETALAFESKARSSAAEGKRIEAALETINATFKTLAEKSEAVAKKIKAAEERSTAGNADIYSY